VPRLNVCRKQTCFVGLVIQETGHAFEQIRGVLSFKMEVGISLPITVQVNHV